MPHTSNEPVADDAPALHFDVTMDNVGTITLGLYDLTTVVDVQQISLLLACGCHLGLHDLTVIRRS